MNTPRSLAAASLRRPSEPSQPQGFYRSPPSNYINVGSFSNSDTHSLCSPQAPATTDGPLKTLNNFQEEETVEVETHDPITRSNITEGEAYVLLRLQVSQSFWLQRMRLTVTVISRAVIQMRHSSISASIRMLKDYVLTVRCFSLPYYPSARASGVPRLSIKFSTASISFD